MLLRIMNYVKFLIPVKSVVKLSLPDIKTKQSFFVKYSDSYYTYDNYLNWEANKFKIDPFYFQGNKINHLLYFDYIKRKIDKHKYLKIKLLYNQAVKDFSSLNEVSDVFEMPKDIIIFITGGGFVNDFEKVAQYYLREIVNDMSLPVFIIKYRYF